MILPRGNFIRYVIILLLAFLVAVKGTFYGATSSEIIFSGRRYTNGSSVSYDWPCFRIVFCFSGSTKVVWAVKDGWNIYKLILDGNVATRIKPGKESNLTIFQSKNPESHCVQIVKMTENHYGPIASHVDSVFHGIQLTGGVLVKKEESYRYRFDFLGDSITTAFGVLSGTNPICFLKMKQIQDCTESWATHLSRKFNADYRVMAVSGKGVLHNSYGVPGPKMGSLYTRTTDNSRPFSYKYQDGVIPDVIFFLIGANDYSHPIRPNPGRFVNAYREMLETELKEVLWIDPTAKPLLINVCAADMLKEQRVTVQRAVKEFKYEYNSTFYVEIPHGPLRKLGCIGHPNVEGQREMAETLYPQVKQLLDKYLPSASSVIVE